MRRAALLGLALLLAGCTGPIAPAPAPAPPGPADGGPGGPAEGEILAAARAFHGLDAWHLAAAQVATGCSPAPPGAVDLCAGSPRYRATGSAGNNDTAAMLAQLLAEAGFPARLDPFEATFEGRPLPAHNVVAERPGTGGARGPVLLLGAHYDSRPCADKDPDPAKRDQPVLGANDGASGVGVLLQLARLLAPRSMNLTLRILLFDAEDMGDGGLGCGQGTAWAQGSAHYAASLGPEEVQRARGFVLLDMVGGEEAQFRREGASAAPPHRALQDDLWAWAAKLGHAQFVNATGPAILDDHAPFQQRGIASVDVIHLDDGRDVFPDTHHTTHDDLGHLSPDSLEAAGQTVLAAVLAWDAAAGQDRGLM